MENKITIQFENGEEALCDVLCLFETDEHEYIALLPEDGEEVFLYRYEEQDGAIALDNIETDEEYEQVAEIFEAILEEEHDHDHECGCGCNDEEEKHECECGGNCGCE